MLEPRRMAARAASWRMADLPGEASGATSATTCASNVAWPRYADHRPHRRLLSRRIAADPELADAGRLSSTISTSAAVNADDFGLALALDVQRNLRPDLHPRRPPRSTPAPWRATRRRARRLRRRADVPRGDRLARVRRRSASPERTAAIVRRALAERPGSVLAFLPGEGEIRAAAEILGGAASPGTDLVPLYAALPKGEQDAAPRSPPDAARSSHFHRRVVADDRRHRRRRGLRSRASRAPTPLGMSRLETVAIARDRADQRRAAPAASAPASATASGARRRCAARRRLSRNPHRRPRPLRSRRRLELVRGGLLPWLTPPPASTWRRFRICSRPPGADSAGRITPRGPHGASGHASAPRPRHDRVSPPAATPNPAARLPARRDPLRRPRRRARLSSNIAHLLGEIETPAAPSPPPSASASANSPPPGTASSTASPWRSPHPAPSPSGSCSPGRTRTASVSDASSRTTPVATCSAADAARSCGPATRSRPATGSAWRRSTTATPTPRSALPPDRAGRGGTPHLFHTVAAIAWNARLHRSRRTRDVRRRSANVAQTRRRGDPTVSTASARRASSG